MHYTFVNSRILCPAYRSRPVLPLLPSLVISWDFQLHMNGWHMQSGARNMVLPSRRRFLVYAEVLLYNRRCYATPRLHPVCHCLRLLERCKAFAWPSERDNFRSASLHHAIRLVRQLFAISNTLWFSPFSKTIGWDGTGRYNFKEWALNLWSIVVRFKVSWTLSHVGITCLQSIMGRESSCVVCWTTPAIWMSMLFSEWSWHLQYAVNNNVY